MEKSTEIFEFIMCAWCSFFLVFDWKSSFHSVVEVPSQFTENHKIGDCGSDHLKKELPNIWNAKFG